MVNTCELVLLDGTNRKSILKKLPVEYDICTSYVSEAVHKTWLCLLNSHLKR